MHGQDVEADILVTLEEALQWIHPADFVSPWGIGKGSDLYGEDSARSSRGTA